jgi:hypothetical protein
VRLSNGSASSEILVPTADRNGIVGTKDHWQRSRADFILVQTTLDPAGGRAANASAIATVN